MFPRGLRYDGRIKYDHGQEIRFDGSGAYNGERNYRNVAGQTGSVSEFVKIPEVFNGTRTYGGRYLIRGIRRYGRQRIYQTRQPIAAEITIPCQYK